MFPNSKRDNATSLHKTIKKMFQDKDTKNPTIKQQAKEYLHAGFSVVPCGKSKKAAIGWSIFQEDRMNEEEFEASFNSNTEAVGIIAGEVSGGLFFIDIDNKLGTATTNLNRLISSLSYLAILDGKNNLIVSTQSGGYHLYYRVIRGGVPSSTKCAFEYCGGEKHVAIETRGVGSYVLAPPTPGYLTIEGSFHAIPELTNIQLDSILDVARTYDEVPPATATENGTETEDKDKDKDKEARRKNAFKNLINTQFSWYSFRLLLQNGWQITPGNDHTKLTRPGKNPNEGSSATFGYRGGNTFKVFSESDDIFKAEKTYTPFEVISNLQFHGNERACLKWFKSNYDLHPNAKNYIRSGDDYFEIYHKKDRFFIDEEVIAPRKKETITLDHGSTILKAIPKYKAFVVVPDNVNHNDVIFNNFFNLYRPLPHKAKAGNCDKTLNFVRHIFCEQYELGLDYLQLLYLKPKQRLPALVVVSKEQQTGKTTFVEWLNNIFSQNAAVIESKQFDNQFSVTFAHKNLILCDEAIVRDAITFERLKRLVTQSKIIVNEKYIKTFEVDFFGKLVISGNREEDIVRIANNETRYWIRKIALPKKANLNLAMELAREIPAFLAFLAEREMFVKQPESRLYFSPERTQTDQSNIVKDNSRPTLAKEIEENLIDFFYKNQEKHKDAVLATAKEIKDAWFRNNHSFSLSYIKTILRDEFGLEPSKTITRYQPLTDTDGFFENGENHKFSETKTGRPYSFKRGDFVDEGLKNETDNFDL